MTHDDAQRCPGLDHGTFIAKDPESLFAPVSTGTERNLWLQRTPSSRHRSQRFAFTWYDDSSLVAFQLQPQQNGTGSVHESGIPANAPKRLVECATGWGEALTLLEVYAE